MIRPFLTGAVEGIRRFKTDKAFARLQIGKYLRVEDDKVLEEIHQLFAELFECVPYDRRPKRDCEHRGSIYNIECGHGGSI